VEQPLTCAAVVGPDDTGAALVRVPRAYQTKQDHGTPKSDKKTRFHSSSPYFYDECLREEP